MATIRVLVVEDSLTVRAAPVRGARRAIPSSRSSARPPTASARSSSATTLRPDVITHGHDAAGHDAASRPPSTSWRTVPTPILIVSASTNRGELFKTYDALAAGAVDVLEKPRGDEPDGEWERRFLADAEAGLAHPGHHPSARRACRRGSTAATRPLARCRDPRADRRRRSARLVAIGASTGGPGALVEILRGLPAGFPLPVLIVLHINEPFGAAFADWLDGQTRAPGRATRATATLVADGAGPRRDGAARTATWSSRGGALAPDARIPSATPAARRSTCCSSRSRARWERRPSPACWRAEPVGGN